MDRRVFLKTAGAGALALSLPGSALAWLSGLTDDQIEAKIKEVLPKMTLDEKTGIMAGQLRGLMEEYRKNKTVKKDNSQDHDYTGKTTGVERLGVPPILCLDGPRGVGFDYKATSFPVGTCRAATWDPAIEEAVGEAAGYETRAYKANMLLAPCVNLLWHPRWGRAQESYGEDTVLLGAMGAAFVRGLQKHVMACTKHYAVNNTEDNRTSVDAQVDERLLREVFLPHFKECCVDAGSASVMSSYNDINGYLASENKHLLRDILKGDWDWDGMVLSDWGPAVEHTVPPALAGLDVQMPGPTYFGPKLAKAVRDGKVPEAVIDEAITRQLRQLFRFVKDNYTAGYERAKVAGPEHSAVSQRAAEKGMVLLKNQDGLLPLDPAKIKELLVCGSLADEKVKVIGDHGSSRITPPYVVSPLAGLQKRFGADKVVFEPDPKKVAAAAADACAVIACVGGEYEGEGNDRKTLNLTPTDAALLKAVAAANPRTVAVVFGGSAMIFDAEAPAAIVYAWFPGMDAGTSIGRLLAGDVNPSGKLPIHFPKSEAGLYPFGNKGKVFKIEGFHGYRYADAKKLPALFPFGFGLSYTTFKYANAQVAKAPADQSGELVVTVEITNTGSRAGEEAAQLYVAAPGRAVSRAPKELKGFAKTALEPGETRTVTIKVPAEKLCYWDTGANGWKLEPGDYRALVGPSSRDEDLLGAGFKV